MSKAEERALQYSGLPCSPSSINEKTKFYAVKNERYFAFLDGYHEAEKDLALTWMDIREILSIADEVERDHDCSVKAKCELCEEVLRRFNETRK